MAGKVLRKAAAVAALGLAACGGGGGGGGGGGYSAPPTYTIGGAVTGLAAGESVTLANGSDSVTVSGNTTFVFATAVQQSGSYSVTVKTQPVAQNCVVSSGSGSGVMANVTAVAIACTNLAQFAYVVNNGDDTVSQFSIDGATGLLVPQTVASVKTGNSPQSVTVDPSHHYVYITNLTDNTISQYVIQSDGTLAPNTPATVATGLGPWAVTLSPSGNWAYVVNSTDNTISQFSVSPSGTLVATAIAPIAAGPEPWNLTLSPDGKYAYVSDHGTGAPAAGMSISQYSIDASSGALSVLTPSSIFSESTYPAGIAVDANSAFAYVANITGDTLAQYAIGADGTLSKLAPVTVAAGTEPAYVAIDPSNQYVYAANFTIDVNPGMAGTVSQYTLGTSGQLTPMATPAVAAGVGPAWMAFDSFGHYLYVTNVGNGTLPGTVSEYSIGTGGALTLIGTIAAGKSTFMIATTY
jgi:6-phosphogluconolactonase (cycloisomerase 2 family)